LFWAPGEGVSNSLWEREFPTPFFFKKNYPGFQTRVVQNRLIYLNLCSDYKLPSKRQNISY